MDNFAYEDSLADLSAHEKTLQNTNKEKDESTDRNCKEPPSTILSTRRKSSLQTYEIGVTYKRWVNLLLFCLLSTVSTMHWFQYSVISNVIQDYYHISTTSIDWTSEIIMVMNIVFIYPALLFLEKVGLRSYIVTGTYLTMLGAYLKQQATGPNTFWLAFTGQSIVALSQVFLYNVPPQLAATWFKKNEVSIACGVGIFGMQLGLALGFVLPPYIVDAEDRDNVEKNLEIMNRIFAFAAIVVGALVISFFDDRPEIPPSIAEAKKRILEDSRYSEGDSNTCKHCEKINIQNNFEKSANKSKSSFDAKNIDLEKYALDDVSDKKPAFRYAELLKNRGFQKLLICYGINGGVFCAISTLLNPIILEHYPGKETMVGILGLLLMISGLVGCFCAGIPLSLTHQYKLVNALFYFMIIVCLVLFSAAVSSGSENTYILYITAILLGFFMTGLFTVEIEFAAELTYPESECASSGFLNASCFSFGILFTSVHSWALGAFGSDIVNWTSVALLSVGFIVSLLIKSDLRRQAAGNAMEEEEGKK